MEVAHFSFFQKYTVWQVEMVFSAIQISERKADVRKKKALMLPSLKWQALYIFINSNIQQDFNKDPLYPRVVGTVIGHKKKKSVNEMMPQCARG